jgi:hypothetical protein
VSEYIRRILLDELTTFRIVCLHCGAAHEMKIEQVRGLQHPAKCICCGLEFRSSHFGQVSEDAYDYLAAAIQSLKAIKQCRFEFVLPAEENKPATQS